MTHISRTFAHFNSVPIVTWRNIDDSSVNTTNRANKNSNWVLTNNKSLVISLTKFIWKLICFFAENQPFFFAFFHPLGRTHQVYPWVRDIFNLIKNNNYWFLILNGWWWADEEGYSSRIPTPKHVSRSICSIQSTSEFLSTTFSLFLF